MAILALDPMIIDPVIRSHIKIFDGAISWKMKNLSSWKESSTRWKPVLSDWFGISRVKFTQGTRLLSFTHNSQPGKNNVGLNPRKQKSVILWSTAVSCSAKLCSLNRKYRQCQWVNQGPSYGTTATWQCWSHELTSAYEMLKNKTQTLNSVTKTSWCWV